MKLLQSNYHITAIKDGTGGSGDTAIRQRITIARVSVPC